jgi:hypothetical protein
MPLIHYSKRFLPFSSKKKTERKKGGQISIGATQVDLISNPAATRFTSRSKQSAHPSPSVLLPNHDNTTTVVASGRPSDRFNI